MVSLNPVSAGLVTLLPELMRSKNWLNSISTRKPKYFIDQAAPRFELGIKDLQSPALPLGHAAKKSDRKSRKQQVFIHVFLRKAPFFYFEYNSTYFFPIFFKKSIPAFFDPVSIILLDRFYLKTYIANTIKLPISFYWDEKEEKWISSHRLQNSEQIGTIN